MTIDQKFMLISEAAELLSCSVDRIAELSDQGMIRRHIEVDQVFVRKEDVIEIHRLNIVGEMKPGEMVRRLLLLEQEVRRLRASVDMLYEVNGLSSSRFAELEDDELLMLYRNIIDLLAATNWPVDRMDSVSEVFIRISEAEIDRINEMENMEKGWLPFLQLCLKMTKYVSKRKDLRKDLDLQRVFTKLAIGRKNLVGIGLFFVEKGALLSSSRKLLTQIAYADIDAFDVIARTIKHDGNLDLIS